MDRWLAELLMRLTMTAMLVGRVTVPMTRRPEALPNAAPNPGENSSKHSEREVWLIPSRPFNRS